MKKLSYIIVSLSAITVNCNKNNADANPSTAYFPNSVGNKYTYCVTDSGNTNNTITTYNVNVSVVGKTTLSNGLPVTIWTYTYPNSKDTNYVSLTIDSAVFYDKTKAFVINRYAIPLVAGAKWNIQYTRDTTTVFSNNPLTIKAGTFSQIFLLSEHNKAENYILIKNQWFVPNIGMVKMYIKELTFGHPAVKKWELSSYKINSR